MAPRLAVSAPAAAAAPAPLQRLRRRRRSPAACSRSLLPVCRSLLWRSVLGCDALPGMHPASAKSQTLSARPVTDQTLPQWSLSSSTALQTSRGPRMPPQFALLLQAEPPATRSRCSNRLNGCALNGSRPGATQTLSEPTHPMDFHFAHSMQVYAAVVLNVLQTRGFTCHMILPVMVLHRGSEVCSAVCLCSATTSSAGRDRILSCCRRFVPARSAAFQVTFETHNVHVATSTFGRVPLDGR